MTIEWERGICVVQPVPEARAPRWAGNPRFLRYELCQAMRGVLMSQEDDPALSQRARRVMETLRAEYSFLQDEPSPLLQSADEIRWWNFAGGAANLLLARVLEAELGGKVVSRNTSISLKDEAGESLGAVRAALRQLAGRGGPSVEDALLHAEGAKTRARLSKFERCLPEDLYYRLIVEGLLDVQGAQRAVTSP